MDNRLFKSLIIISIGLLFLRLGFILTTMVIDDEAYYYIYSRHLAWGYIDHGPLIAFLIKTFTTIFGGNGFGIRVGSVVLVTSLGCFLYIFGKKYFNQNTGAIMSLTVLTNVLFHTNGVVMTPDVPLVFFSFLFIIFYYMAFFNDKSWFLPAGICLGFGLLSKISALFPALGILLFPVLMKSYRRILRQRYFYLSFVLAFIILLPFIIWNMQNDWTFVRYQGAHITEGGSIKTFLELWAGLGILFGPILFAACFFLPFKVLINSKNSENKTEPAHIYFALTSVIPLIYFFTHSLFSRFELNWPAPAFLGGILLFAIKMGGISDKVNKKIIIQIVYSIFLVLLVTVQTYFPFLPLKGKLDITNRYHVFSSFPNELQNYLETESKYKNYRIVANNYQIPSMVNLYIKPELEATCLSIGYHKTLYSFLYPDENLAGGNYLYLTTGKNFPDNLKRYFDEIIFLHQFKSIRRGEVIAKYSLWHVINYHGK